MDSPLDALSNVLIIAITTIMPSMTPIMIPILSQMNSNASIMIRLSNQLSPFCMTCIKTPLVIMANLGLPSALIMELRPLPTTKKGIPKMM